MKILITGGGTGGHIYPALAVARSLEAKGWEILYLGSKGGLEGELVPNEEGLKYQEIDVSPLPRKISIKLISSVLKTSKGFIQAYRIIKKIKPDIVLGTGGFVAGPVVLAATTQKIPSLIHEQNVYPGFTNKLLARRVDMIALNFTAAKDFFSSNIKAKYRHTGNPIRKVILNTDRRTGLLNLNLESKRTTILVFGGSQGSMSINKSMVDVYQHFKNSNFIQIIQITGQKNYQKVINEVKNSGIQLKNYSHFKILPYLNQMEYAYAVADLIIYRAGATGIAEITAKGIPAILIPYPYAAENHQEYNARNLEKNGAAEVILDNDLSGPVLINMIEDLLKNRKKLSTMSNNSKKLGKPEATDNLVKLIEDMVYKNKMPSPPVF